MELGVLQDCVGIGIKEPPESEQNVDAVYFDQTRSTRG